MQHFFPPSLYLCKLLKVNSSACMNWYEVAKYKSSGVLWHSTIQLDVLTSLRTGEVKGVREESIHVSILKWNTDGVALQVLPLDGINGDIIWDFWLLRVCAHWLCIYSRLPCLCCDRACCTLAHCQSLYVALINHCSSDYRQLHAFFLLVTVKVYF